MDIFSALTEEELCAEEKHIAQKLQSVEQKLSRLESQRAKLLQLKETIQHVRVRKQSQNISLRDWEKEDFGWSASVRKVLEEVFHLNNFRPKQLQTINALLSGHDVLLLAPTGGGKSLCYQLPALVTDGLTVVISPLISLMEDQIWSLQKLNISATLLCSSTERSEVTRVLKDVGSASKPSLKLLYVTPERMAKSKRFMSALQKCYTFGHLDRFAIDEVHCCSQWGHDFRSDYKYLGVLKELFPKVPLLGVTATATAKVTEDVQKMLRIQNSLMFVATFNRPNLYYHVLEKPSSKMEQYELLASLLLKRFRKQSGIVYTFSIKDAEDISSELNERGLKVAAYHANLQCATRTQIHHLWVTNSLQAVVATIAFGMGIDKPDVRFVIHHTLSKSMDNFYQETGRAGRDGQRAECILLYHFADMFRISTMMFEEYTGLKNAYSMVEYCINTSECRRKLIAHHFSAVWGPSDCNEMCDRCANRDTAVPREIDARPYLKELCKIIDRSEQYQTKITPLKMVDAWLHKGPVKLRPDTPAPFISRGVAEQIVAFLILHDYLKEDFVYTPYSTLSYITNGNKKLPASGEPLPVRAGELQRLLVGTVNGTSSEEPAIKRKSNAKRSTSDPSTAPSSKRAKSSASRVVTSENLDQSALDDENDDLFLTVNNDVIEIDVD